MILGDSHANFRFIKEAINLTKGARADAIMVVGDFGYWTHTKQGIAFLERVDQHAAKSNVLVTFIDGNHENFKNLYKHPVSDDGWRRITDNIWHAPRGHIWEWDNVTFFGMGGAHSIDGPGGPDWWEQARGPLDKSYVVPDGRNARTFIDGDRVVIPAGHDLGGWWPEETIKVEEAQQAMENIHWRHAQGKTIDVMFSHDAPTVTQLGLTGYPAGDKNRALLQQVYESAKPKWLFHGHYHRFNHYTDYNLDSVHVCLAHDAAPIGKEQYCWLDTNGGNYEVTIPTQKKKR